MNRKTVAASLLAVPLGLLIACAPPPLIYQPSAAVTTQTPHYAADVALAENKTVAVQQFEGHNAFNPTMTGWSMYLGTNKLTDYVVQDLSASGLFSSVVHKGEGAADVDIQPTYVNAVVKDWGVGGLIWYLGVQFDVTKKGQPLMSKRYDRKWHVGAFAGPKAWVDAIAQNVQGMMDDVRKDLAVALAGGTVQQAPAGGGAPSTAEPAQAASPQPL